MAAYEIEMVLAPGLTESERQRRIARAFRLLMTPLGVDAERARGVDIQGQAEAERQLEKE